MIFIIFANSKQCFNEQPYKAIFGTSLKKKKAGLKLNTQKTNIMASSLTSWQTDGAKGETVTDFIFLGSKITEDCDCSHSIKRCLLLVRTAKTNLYSVLKSRYITLLTKGCIVKAMVFPVAMYRCES